MDIPKKVKLINAGEVFGYWTVLGFSHVGTNKAKLAMYHVVCSCGNRKTVPGTSLRRGISTKCKSCNGRIRGRRGLYRQTERAPVYFIRCGDFLKIGASQDPERRLKDMESNNPFDLELIGVDENEEFWHGVFKHRHFKNEWYYL